MYDYECVYLDNVGRPIIGQLFHILTNFEKIPPNYNDRRLMINPPFCLTHFRSNW